MSVAPRWFALGVALALLVAGGPAGGPARAQQAPDGADRVQALEQDVAGLRARVDALAGRLDRMQRLREAEAALDAGQPLGDLPGNVPALARFATTAPPTLAALRAQFPEAARAARAASEPPAEGMGFLARMEQRAASLVTIREGDRVVVGAPAAGPLAEARAMLDRGDLAGALARTDQLDPAARQAMAAWRDQARALLDARAALAVAAR